MAVEASRHTNQTADSYIGSLISLISKSDIRYEGFLCNIDTAQSTFALRNVRSFGTEGRKKDGLQFPSSDKIYEYILFRGSDIMDLQVKSSPPVQTTESIYSDPAIIQSRIPQEAATSTSLPFADSTRPQQEPNSYTSYLGLPNSFAQSSVPVYQPGGSLGSWGSMYSLPTTNDSLPVRMYIKEKHGASDELKAQQQSLLQPPPGLLTCSSSQKMMPYPALSASISSMSSNMTLPPLSDTPPPVLPSISPITPNLHLPLFSSQSSASPSDLSATSKPSKGPIQGFCSADMSTTSLPLLTPPIAAFNESAFLTAGAVQSTVDSKSLFNNVLVSKKDVASASGSFLNKGLIPPLVTPSHFLQPGTSIASFSQSSQSVQKVPEVVQLASTGQTLETLPGDKAPILPLPPLVNYKIHGDASDSHYINRRGRGQGHWASDNVTSFTEEFDFVSMNKKFNKDEVWGQLGKNNSTQEDRYSQDKDNVLKTWKTTSETKPVYVKDDFFDSLSSNTSAGSNRGRSNFSGSNTGTFGKSARHRVGHGTRGYSCNACDGYSYHYAGHEFDDGGQLCDSHNSGRN